MIAITEKEFRQLADFMKNIYGINLTDRKLTLVEGRLSNVLHQKNFKRFSDFYEYLISDKSGEAVRTLVEKLTTNHTYFMRETEHFRYFRDKVLPFLASAASNRDLRIWSAGCSTGEEPYTLAMLISDFFGANRMLWDTKVLATDISMKVLDTASRGIYSNEHIDSLPENWKKNYFKRVDSDNSMVVERIRNEVIFQIFNLMEPSLPFKKKFHVIFCRNVMIYFDSATKKALVDRFYHFTEPGGFLFIGHSESLVREETGYKYIMPSVYRKE